MFKRVTRNMTPAQRAAWFRKEGRWNYEQRHSAFMTRESIYVNAAFRCSAYALQVGLRSARAKQGEWYHQATYGGNEWTL